jgi:membrane-associated phospholipid phosphatase
MAETPKKKKSAAKLARQAASKKAQRPRAPKPDEPPEQELGDTPVAPWNMPTPAEKQQARPVRKALQDAVGKIDSPAKADEVIEDIEAATAGETAGDAEQAEQQAAAAGTARAAKNIQRAAQTAPPSRKPEKVLEATARALASPDSRQREVISEAAQEVLNPEQQGTPPTVANPRQRELLRRAVLKRLKPLDALDADLFLKVNHLPHTRLLNRLFYALTMVYTGGAAWYITMMLSTVRRPRNALPLLREAAIPMAISSSLVEYPIKNYFKRRRPFITIIQAIVIGKKPGHYSFPSGHSAAAFAGAWLINQEHPRWSPLTYTAAALVAFSRVYLGDHYPGDVVSGSGLGVLFAMAFNWLLRRRKRPSLPRPNRGQ